MSIINSRGIFNLGTAYLRQVGNDWPTAQVISTSDITEGINLYYNNARVYSNVIALLPTLAGSGIAIQANGQISANAAVVTFGSISQYLTTSNVSEGSNLYYTNARVYANITAALAGNITVGNLVVNASTANSYTTTGNINAGNVIATSITIGSSIANSYTTTGNVNAPQYFTDVTLTLNKSEIPLTFNTITSAVVQITGIDTGYCNGNHGPLVEYVTLTAS